MLGLVEYLAETCRPWLRRRGSLAVGMVVCLAAGLSAAGVAEDANSVWSAAEKGDVAYVRRAIAAAPKLLNAAHGPQGETLLHVAARCEGQRGMDIALLLLAKGAKADPMDKAGRTPLHLAAYWGALEVAEVLLDRKANPNAADGRGRTPLHWAAYIELPREGFAGRPERACFCPVPLPPFTSPAPLDGAQARRLGGRPRYAPYVTDFCKRKTMLLALLLKNGANPSPKDDSAHTPLHWACDAERDIALEAVAALLKAKADTDIRDSQGRTPLHWAALAKDESIVPLLLEAGADVTITDAAGRTPCDIALTGPLPTLKLLQKEAACPGLGALCDAAWKGQTQRVVELVRARPAAVRGTDAAGATPLHYAASGPDASAVVFLLEQGADANAADSRGSTPLHAACGRFWPRVSVSLAVGARLREDDDRELKPAGSATVASLLAAGAGINARSAGGYTPLHAAAEADVVDGALAELLSSGADVNARASNGSTPLHLAAAEGHPANIKSLLAWGADAGLVDGRGQTPLQAAAARHGRLSYVGNLLAQAGADPNAVDRDGNRAMHLAVTLLPGHGGARGGRDVDWLLKHGVKPDPVDPNGRTPLHRAVALADLEAARTLLAGGASPNAKDKQGWTPLHWCVRREWKAPEVAVLLLGCGADPKARANDDQTALDMARKKGLGDLVAVLEVAEGPGGPGRAAEALEQKRTRKVAARPPEPVWRGPPTQPAGAGDGQVVPAVLRGDIPAVENLLKANPALARGADVHGRTVLHLAAWRGQTDVVRLLLAQEADPDAQDGAGWTPLHWASRAGAVEPARLLIQAGAGLNDIDNNGRTPLHQAVVAGNAELVRLLLDSGAAIRPETRTEGYRRSRTSPLPLAVSTGRQDLVKLLLDRGVGPDAMGGGPPDVPLVLAIQRGDLAVAELLLARGASANAGRDERDMPLNAAVRCDPNMVRLLLRHKADPRRINGWGFPILAVCRNPAAAELLIAAGADVNGDAGLNGAADGASWRRIPIVHAAEEGRADIVAVLLAKGAKVNWTGRGDTGWTALAIAAVRGKPQVVELLRRHGGAILGAEGLFQAAYDGNAAAVSKALVAQPTAWKLPDACGWTALHWAALGGRTEVARLLLDRGASPDDSPGDYASTPLTLAAEGGFRDLVALFLERRPARPPGPAARGSSPLRAACAAGRTAVVELLLDKGADLLEEPNWGPLYFAAAGGHLAVVKVLLDRGAGKDAKTFAAAVFAAAEKCHPDVVTYMVDRGAPMSYEWNGHTETLLHKVASSGNPELAAALLKRGADAKTVCSIGYTTLHRAVPSGSSELVKLLLDAGADEMARTSDRRTALNIAQVCRSEEVFQFLASRPSTIVLRVQPR